MSDFICCRQLPLHEVTFKPYPNGGRQKRFGRVRCTANAPDGCCTEAENEYDSLQAAQAACDALNQDKTCPEWRQVGTMALAKFRLDMALKDYMDTRAGVAEYIAVRYPSQAMPVDVGMTNVQNAIRDAHEANLAHLRSVV